MKYKAEGLTPSPYQEAMARIGELEADNAKLKLALTKRVFDELITP